MRQRLLSAIAAAAFFLMFLLFSGYTKESDRLSAKATSADGEHSLSQIIQAPYIPEQADFCGEALPMHESDSRERLDQELIANSYRHSGTILYIKKANKYFPTIERILEEEGMPDDLKYLCVAESGLSHAKSPAGAKGFWQFMSGTGKEYGLTVNSEVDERFHLEKSTRAACRYLRSLKQRFGSWSFAAAAYNMGGANLKKNLSRQKADTYFDLNINRETMRYVYRIVAIKEIMEHPRRYGFYVDDFQKYAPLPSTYGVEVNGAVDSWADFAAEYGISYRKLKIHNPWLVDSKLTNSRKAKYEISIPK